MYLVRHQARVLSRGSIQGLLLQLGRAIVHVAVENAAATLSTRKQPVDLRIGGTTIVLSNSLCAAIVSGPRRRP